MEFLKNSRKLVKGCKMIYFNTPFLIRVSINKNLCQPALIGLTLVSIT